MDKQIEAGGAFKRYEQLKKAYLGINIMYLEVGRQLKWFKEKDRYKFIEGAGSTWTEFVSKIAIGRQHSYDLIALYEQFVERWQIPEDLLAQTDRRRLISTLPFVRQADNRDYVLEKVHQAKELSRSDLSVALKQEKYPDHKHDWEEVFYWQCKICGEKSYGDPNI